MTVHVPADRGRLLLGLCLLAVAPASGCDRWHPQAPTCTDGVANGSETDVDCGGACVACQVGLACRSAADCVTRSCQVDRCTAATCSDGVRNGDETDVDCGGGCPPCAPGGRCVVGQDCSAGVCDPASSFCAAPGCRDGVQNGDETDVDCGGACPPCGAGMACASSADCESRVCSDAQCAAATCADGVQNGDEQDVDCGGSCPRYCLSLLPPVEVTGILFSTGPLTAPYDPNAGELEVDSLYAGMDFTMMVTGAPGGQVLIDDSAVDLNCPFTMQVPRLAPDTMIRLRYRNTAGTVVEQAVKTLPGDFPTYRVTADEPVPGTILLGPSDWNQTLPPFILLLDAAGHPLFYRRLVGYAFSFEWHELPDGTLRYSYNTVGRTYVTDDHFRVIATYSLLATTRHPEGWTDGHDFVLLDHDHYILTSPLPKPAENLPPELAGDNPQPCVFATVIQEVQNGQVIFEWDSTDHPALYALSTAGNDFAASSGSAPADYTHWNSIQVDPLDGNLLLSFRNLDAILKVDRQDGSIMWILGGAGDQFGLSEAQQFSHQHFARFQAGRDLLFFDNGNARGQTRLVRMALDESRKQLESYLALDTGRLSEWMGSVQASSSSTFFIGWGYHPPGEPAVTEIEPVTGRVRFSLTFDLAYNSYRALKKLDSP